MIQLNAKSSKFIFRIFFVAFAFCPFLFSMEVSKTQLRQISLEEKRNRSFAQTIPAKLGLGKKIRAKITQATRLASKNRNKLITGILLTSLIGNAAAIDTKAQIHRAFEPVSALVPGMRLAADFDICTSRANNTKICCNINANYSLDCCMFNEKSELVAAHSCGTTGFDERISSKAIQKEIDKIDSYCDQKIKDKKNDIPNAELRQIEKHLKSSAASDKKIVGPQGHFLFKSFSATKRTTPYLFSAIEHMTKGINLPMPELEIMDHSPFPTALFNQYFYDEYWDRISFIRDLLTLKKITLFIPFNFIKHTPLPFIKAIIAHELGHYKQAWLGRFALNNQLFYNSTQAEIAWHQFITTTRNHISFHTRNNDESEADIYSMIVYGKDLICSLPFMSNQPLYADNIPVITSENLKTSLEENIDERGHPLHHARAGFIIALHARLEQLEKKLTIK